jgi:hypothetical protein
MPHVRSLDLHDYRATQRSKKQWGSTKLHSAYFHEPTSQLFKRYAKLDAIVRQTYRCDPDDRLEKLGNG